MSTRPVKLLRWAFPLLLVCASAWALRDPGPAVPATPAVPLVPAASTVADSRRADEWLIDLQRGADARHRERPEEAAQIRLPVAVAGTPPIAAPRVRALLEAKRFEVWQQRLQQAELPATIQARLADARSRVLRALDTRTKSAQPEPEVEPRVAILGSALPLQRGSWAAPPLDVGGTVVVPSYQQSPVPAPSANDLRDGPDTPLHPEIVAKAAELGHEYTRILDFVRGGIRTEWYPGSQRGALGCLRARAGNDVDQASLLIALLRASNVPARYVQGVGRLSLAELEASLNLQGQAAVLRALNRALRPHRPVIQGGVITGVEFDQTWVSALVPFAHYRGSAATQSGRVWLPFAPAVKPHAARAATRVLSAAAIDTETLVTEFLTSEPGMSPLERLRALVQPYLAANPAAGTYADQLALVRPSGADLELLPASLPFAVVAVQRESAELPPGTSATVRISVRDQARELLVVDVPLLEASTRRLTVSFQPATADDQNLLNSLGGGLSEVPPYLYQLRPRLSLGGEVRAVGEAVEAAKDLNLLVQTEVGGESRTVEQTLVSGGIAAILVDSGSPRPPEEPGDLVLEDTEPPVSRVLGNLAARYASECRADSGELADLLGLRPIEPLPSITLALTQMDIPRVDGVPMQLHFDSVAIDAAARGVDVVSRGGHQADERQWFALAALQCSYLEHRVFEDQWAVPAISADRGLARAHLAGLAMLQLEGAAGTAQLPSLAHPESVKQALAAWLQLGHRIRIPATALDVGAWRGSVWQVIAADGSAGYFVSGGLAGGVTVLPVSEWFLASLGALFANPYGAAPNLDPTDVLKIRLFDDSDQQIATVGTELPIPLRARIEDPNGRPVVGASVTFSVVAGDGRLTGGSSTGSSVTLTSDRHGLAEVRLRLGTEINSGRYVSERPDDPELHPQFMGVNLVRIRAASRYAPDGIIAGTDYEAFGRPDDVRRIELYGPPIFQYPDGTEVVATHAGVGYATWSLKAVDEFGNRIANAPIHLATEFSPIIRDLVDFQCPTSAYAGATPGGAFLPGDCPEGEAMLTGHSCLRTNIDFKTRASDNVFHVAPHNAAGLELNVTVSTPGAAPKLLILHNATNQDALRFCQSARSQWDVVITHAIVHQGGAAHAVGEGDISDNTGSNPGYYFTRTDSIESARPGEWLPVPRRFTLYSMENPYPPQNDLLVTWVARLPGPFYPGNHPSVTPDVIMTTSSGAIASRATWLGGGLFEYNVRMPPAPGKVEVGGRMRTPGNFVVRLDFSFPAVWSVLPRIADVDPLPFALSAAGTVADDLSIRLQVAPPEYLGGDTVVEFEKSGETIQRGIGPPLLDAGTLMYGRGWSYDPTENYSVKFSINEGTPYRIESDRFPLTASTDVIVGVGLHSGEGGSLSSGEATALALRGTDHAHMLRPINISAGDYCRRSGELVFLLARRARIRADYYRMDQHGNVSTSFGGTLIDDEWFDAGLGHREVLADNLPIGRFQLRVRAVAESGATEELRTTLTNQLDRRDHLALGHTVVADVDLFDGQVTVSRQDLRLPGRGPEVALQRTWSSQQGARIGSLGRGWSSNLNVELHLGACRPQLIGAQGAGTEFEVAGTEPDGSLRYRALHGYHGTLYQRLDGTYDVYAKDGTRYHFASGNSYLNLANNSRIIPVAFTEDPNGNRVTRSYRWLGSVPVPSSLAGSGGRSLQLEYELRPTGGDYEEPSSYPLLVRARAPGGFELLFTYDDKAQLIRARRMDAPADESYTYQDFGFATGTDDSFHRLGSRMLSVRDEIASRTRQSFAYQLEWVHSPRGDGNIDVLPELRVIRHSNALALATLFDFQGLRGLGQAVNTVVTNPRGFATNYRMNGFGGVDRVVDPVGTTQTEWNLEHRQPSRQVDREAVVTEFEYDAYGNILRERRLGRGLPVEQRYTWKTPEDFDTRILNRPASHTDYAGVGEIYQYDPRGNRVSRTRSGETETWTYAANGDVASWTDFEDAQTTYTYSTMGLPERTVYADSAVARQSYDARGRLRSRTDEVGRVESFAYDGLDRVTVTTFADGSQRETRYLDAQDIRREQDELGRVTVNQLDALGRTLRTTNPLGDSREMGYDENGNLTRERKFDGTQITHEYDALDRRMRTIEPLGRVTERDYDRAGNLVEERVAVGPQQRTARHQYQHARYFRTQTARLLDSRELATLEGRDGEGRLTHLTDPLGRETEIDYDGFGREIERIESLGRVTQRNYDGMGRLTSEILQFPGAPGLTRSWSYDVRGRETGAIDRAGGHHVKSYDAAGQLLGVTDPTGRTTTFTYDGRGRVLSETRPGDGRVRNVTYDAVGNVESETRPSQSPITHTYDELNRRRVSADALGTIEELDYDAESRVIARRDPIGAETTYDYDDLGRQTLETRPLGRLWTRTWTLHDELGSETNLRGLVITHQYDSLGRRISTTDTAGTQTFAYDDVGNQTRHADRLQRATVYEFDALNRRVRQLDPPPLATHRTWRHDALDRVIGETDRNGIETMLTLDGEGRELQRSRTGRTELQSYDAAGRRISHTDGQGRVITFVYDTAGRLQEERRPLGATLRFDYGPADQLLSSIDADGITTASEYDLRLRKISETNALGEKTAFEYDGRGLRTAIVKPESVDHRWKYDYDTAGRLERVTDPLGNATSYGYDLADNLERVTSARGQITELEYDPLNRLRRTEHPGDAEELFTPDAEGNRVVWVRENGQRLEMDYDPLNRLTETRRLPAAADGITRVSRVYDGNGNLKRVEEHGSAGAPRLWTADYDSFNRRIEWTDRNGITVRQRFDASDNRIERIGPEGSTVYTYNALNQLQGVTPPAATATTAVVSRAGRLSALEHANGTRTEVSRDSAGRISQLRHALGAAALLTLGYTLDANGHRVAETWERSGERIEIAYELDLAERLKAVTTAGERIEYTLDDVGNRTAETHPGGLLRTHEYDLRDRLTETQDNGQVVASYAYDLAGRQTTHTAGGVTREYQYDTQDRLLGVSQGGVPIVRYESDAFGQRSLREAGGQVEQYQWDGTRLAGRTNATGTSLGDYQYAYGWAISSSEGSVRSTPHTDVHGTPQLITDPTAAIAGWTRTDVWGVEKASTGQQSRLGHTGYLKDPLLGDELYAQARQYRAGVGRFTSRDEWSGDNLNPITLNKYLYGNGNPGSYVDPTGKYAEAGHYYTVFIAAKEAGYSTERALTIALYAQLPDEIGTYEAINQATSTPVRLGLSSSLKGLGPVENKSILDVNNVQGGLHSLSGHDSRAMTDAARSVLINAQTDEAAGLAIHPFGDSYSHRVPESEGKTFPQFVGHLIPGAAPDRIVERPGLYAKYVRDLVESLAARENRHIDMERSTEFANSLAAMTEEPLSAAKLRMEARRDGLLSVFDPTFGRDGEMERAEKELTDNLRERALRLITVQEREDGQILLQPERNRLGHFAGTLGHEQSQLAAFYENSLRGKPLEDSMYTDHSDASKMSSHVEAHIESMFKACQLRTCFDHDEGIRVPND